MSYLIFSLFLLFFWFLTFIKFKKLRKEMLISSLIVTPAAINEVFFVPDYWSPDFIFSPNFSIEGFIFCFSIGGIMAVCYEIFMGKNLRHYRLRHSYTGEFIHALIIGIGVIVVYGTYFLFKINFIYSVYIGILVDLILIGITRPDLIKKVIFSGLIFGAFYFVFFLLVSSFIFPEFIRFWNLTNLSGVIIFNKVPLEEIIWAIGFGALLGPVYEYLLSIKLIEKKK